MVAAAKLLRHVGRKRTGLFLAEGANMVEAALVRGLVTDVFATESALARFDALLGSTSVHVVTEKAAKSLSDTVTPVGLVAVCSMPTSRLDDVLAGSPRLVAVAVDTSEPGNAGTLIRLADAMGADAVVLAGHGVDPYNGKCLRASAGSIFALPVLEVADTEALVDGLRGAGLRVLATTLDGDVSLDDADLSAPTAWLFGAEAHGLPSDVAALADARVRIPMSGSAESLNVAAAAAICLYQSSRSARRD
ncbi:RNA methyltransferase [Mycobacterium antarcticum]|uniref:TrmH family RNA methyltransferase n=1 Tax=unclassified Mycolicibacterium TaxID=2636767 RepID=UPI00239373E5|nr:MULTISPECIES: RNA methyltransferase [unclassified Mycolicibacterium]BDX32428.1 RNA methyltransferase [Mycolicibacterium sp. TUM20985]GLP75618.1 RNA methyltransferase [Mycolicibacterium sp. TUM20983]